MKKFDVVLLSLLVFVALYFIFYFSLCSLEVVNDPTIQLTISGIVAFVISCVFFRALIKK